MFFDTKVTISYNAAGSRNDLGEPSRTLTERSADVPARLQNKSARLMFDFPVHIDSTGKTGQVNTILKILWVKRNETIEERDIITDADSNTYIVAEIALHRTHKSALLQREV